MGSAFYLVLCSGSRLGSSRCPWHQLEHVKGSYTVFPYFSSLCDSRACVGGWGGGGDEEVDLGRPESKCSGRMVWGCCVRSGPGIIIKISKLDAPGTHWCLWRPWSAMATALAACGTNQLLRLVTGAGDVGPMEHKAASRAIAAVASTLAKSLLDAAFDVASGFHAVWSGYRGLGSTIVRKIVLLSVVLMCTRSSKRGVLE